MVTGTAAAAVAEEAEGSFSPEAQVRHQSGSITIRDWALSERREGANGVPLTEPRSARLSGAPPH